MPGERIPQAVSLTAAAHFAPAHRMLTTILVLGPAIAKEIRPRHEFVPLR
jgi:hypothetical protein